MKDEFVKIMLEVFNSARPICSKINIGIERNGVENDNLYYEPIEVVEGIMQNIADNLDEVEVLINFISIIEAHSVRENCTPQQIEQFINNRIELITKVWNESFE